ncbi:ATP-binding cassette domain-containing protein [Streptococcus loxodontisalivarius]|uniref:ATPase subunit of ABC transporter with duplicated ATPase domains n=1 Tax=Streptococcus loxodontisalivarius TaxID=1349415 RepID=A0ABS2PTI1_9STRE|nr:ATP-binding cassette domain-containing protein [Streptococcus loxodontisalivarius]MBM7643310.1 ATPase subunit of ABC transporter with duplicated ATPase domains [Streptococcus loxodontisalivarius]
MLQIKQFTLEQIADAKRLIDNLNLTIARGEKCAIIGEEGTGKSSLLRAIANAESLSNYANIGGQISCQASAIAYLSQELDPELTQVSCQDFIYDDMDYDRFDFNRFYQLADQIKLDLDLILNSDKKLGHLSGGQALKLQLLKELAYQPDLILLDEPSNNLDLDSVRWLENFIINSPETIIFLSHDEALLENTATAILHLELIKKRQEPRASYFQGSYKDYKNQRQASFERHYQLAQKEREEHAKKMERYQRIQESVQHNLRQTHDATAGRLVAKKMKAVLSQGKRFEKEAQHFHDIPQDMDKIDLFFSDIQPLAKQKKLLSLTDFKTSTGQVLSLKIYGQDKVVITGKNGIGKTRILKSIAEQLSNKYNLAYMPQNYEEAFKGIETALDFLAQTADQELCRTMLARLQFTREEVNHPLSQLSGGQKAKLFLAQMVLQKADILILDEPTRNLSPTSQPLLRQLLADYPGAIISVSHDRAYIDQVCSRQLELTENGLEEYPK